MQQPLRIRPEERLVAAQEKGRSQPRKEVGIEVGGAAQQYPRVPVPRRGPLNTQDVLVRQHYST
jgi:hypothetical protein